MSTINWNAARQGAQCEHRYIDSACGRFSICRTAGKRSSTHTVLFADDTRGAATKAFFSLFVKTADSCNQHGNYRTLDEAQAAAEALSPPAPVNES
jgi:hypothetical protein